MTMTRPIALLSSLGALAALCLITIHVFADPFGVKSWWRDVQAEPFLYNDPDFLYDRALAYYRSDDRAIARDISRRVLMVQPEYKGAYKLLTAIYLKDKNFQKAEEAARAAAKIDPTDMDAQLGVATALHGQGMDAAAAEAYEIVLNSKTSTATQQDAALRSLTELGEKRAGEKRTDESQPGEGRGR